MKESSAAVARRERFVAFQKSWRQHVASGFVATQDEVNKLAALFQIEPPRLTRRDQYRAFFDTWKSHVAAGFAETQREVAKMGRLFGVAPPQLPRRRK